MIASPLAQAFGVMLEKRRSQLGLSIAEIAIKVSTTATYYKAIEMGRYNLHVSKGLELSQALSDDRIRFSLPNILHILGVISILELTLRSERKDDISILTDEELAQQYIKHAEMYYGKFIDLTAKEIDPQMKLIREKIESLNIFELLKDPQIKSDEIRAKIKDWKLDDYILNFVIEQKAVDEQTGKNFYDPFTNSFFSEFPTFYIAHLLDIKKSLQTLPNKYDYRAFWIWENNNINKIVRVIGICTSKQFLTDRLSMRKYIYSYLDGNSFLDARFIVLDNQETEAGLKSRFEEELKIAINTSIQTLKSRVLNNVKENEENERAISKLEYRLRSIDSEMKKVEFLVPKNHHFNLEDLLTKPGKEQKFNTSWIFEMQDGYNIGVKAVIRNEWRLHDAEYLTYGEAKALTTKLNNFWQEEKKK